jgi:hypothetical protein
VKCNAISSGRYVSVPEDTSGAEWGTPGWPGANNKGYRIHTTEGMNPASTAACQEWCNTVTELPADQSFYSTSSPWSATSTVCGLRKDLLAGKDVLCGLDTRGTTPICALFVGEIGSTLRLEYIQSFADRRVWGEPEFLSASSICYVSPEKISECPPDKEDICAANGIALKTAQASCAHLADREAELYDGCILDFCAAEGDPLIPDHDAFIREFIQDYEKNRPPASPSPPTSPTPLSPPEDMPESPPEVFEPSADGVSAWQDAHCIEDPCNPGSQHCVRLPVGMAVNTDRRASYDRFKNRIFRRNATRVCPDPMPTPTPDPPVTDHWFDFDVSADGPDPASDPPPPPPPAVCPAVAAHTWVAARLYQTCTSACTEAGLTCSTEPTLPTTEQCFLDTTEAMAPRSDGTRMGCNLSWQILPLSGDFLPAKRGSSDRCYYPAPDGPAFSCDVRDAGYYRLCPCD